jgi:hypothetical protein
MWWMPVPEGLRGCRGIVFRQIFGKGTKKEGNINNNLVFICFFCKFAEKLKQKIKL